jgi:hypothetical protein
MSMTAVPISIFFVHAEVRAVGAELLGRDREVDRLQQRIGGASRLRMW